MNIAREKRMFVQITEHERLPAAAMRNADLDALDELIHNDLQFTIPTREVMTKQDDLDAYRTGMMKVTELSVTTRSIEFIEDTTEHKARVIMKGAYGSQSIDGEYTVHRVWKKVGEGWKVISGKSIFLW